MTTTTSNPGFSKLLGELEEEVLHAIAEWDQNYPEEIKKVGYHDSITLIACAAFFPALGSFRRQDKMGKLHKADEKMMMHLIDGIKQIALRLVTDKPEILEQRKVH